MANERRFEEKYSLHLPQLKLGKQQETFELDRSFFEHFEYGLSESGSVKAVLDIHKYERHLDVKLHLTGTMELPCDRCLEPYPQPIDTTHRLIYSFDPDQKFEATEVIQVSEDEPLLSVAQELYDYVHVSLPLRRVPPKSVHQCNPEVLKVLGLDPDGNPLEADDQEEQEMDPRWAALKKLKDQEEE